MNRLFTFKACIILFVLMICQIGLRAQTASKADSNALATSIDTSLTKKANGGVVVKSDTTLLVKAGATLVQRADTTLVINADSTFVRKFNEAVAKQNVELAKKLSDAATPKTDATIPKIDASSPKKDTSSVRIYDNSEGAIKTADTQTKKIESNATPTPVITTPAQQPDNAAASIVTAPVTTAGSAAATIGSSAANTGSVAAGTPVTTTGAALPSNPDNTTAQPKKDDAIQQTNTTNAQQTNTSNTTPVKVDSALVAKADTVPGKKADTTVAKKTDTTIMKKSDTTLVVADTSATEIKAQNGFIEIGGPGLAISANYDARFKKERNGWGFRVGAGYFASGGNTVFTIPFQINYLIGEHSSMLEVGAGTTFMNSTGTNMGNSKWEFDKITGFIATASIGYRYQPEHKGINFRIAFVPILYDEGVIPAGGISVGYTFK